MVNTNDYVIGFTNDSIGSLKSGAKWQFRCDVIYDASSYEFTKLNYY